MPVGAQPGCLNQVMTAGAEPELRNLDLRRMSWMVVIKRELVSGSPKKDCNCKAQINEQTNAEYRLGGLSCTLGRISTLNTNLAGGA